MRVATHTMNTMLRTQALTVQGSYTNALIQQGTGLKSATLSGLDGAAGTVISLQGDLKASANLATRASAARSQVEVAYGAVANIADVVEKARVAITAAISGSVTDTSTLAASAQGWLEDVASQLNTDMGGLPVFGGTSAGGNPVDLEAAGYTPVSTPSTADTGYYQGSGAARVLMVDGSDGLTYGVQADDEGFEKTLRALAELASMTTSPPDTETLQAAYDLLGEGLTRLGKVQENLSDQAQTLDGLIDSQTEFQLYAESALESVRSVDVAEATSRAAQLEVVLQASFSALSSLSRLSLAEYLR
ncbi:flagellin [Pararhodospirillum oryzae]|uniref:Flagellar hook-associated protein FlgL n=1 Tax=Pararhodospirillum oryzae TaxID=478448 RepID=A0A512H5U3_9PROT|nr:flagellin [Pararhodospirillum oryzae]GEO80845.1 flagellar hook-associated protein FlgL [Pararhodospirillum oryzae]